MGPSGTLLYCKSHRTQLSDDMSCSSDTLRQRYNGRLYTHLSNATKLRVGRLWTGSQSISACFSNHGEGTLYRCDTQIRSKPGTGPEPYKREVWGCRANHQTTVSQQIRQIQKKKKTQEIKITPPKVQPQHGVSHTKQRGMNLAACCRLRQGWGLRAAIPFQWRPVWQSTFLWDLRPQWGEHRSRSWWAGGRKEC